MAVRIKVPSNGKNGVVGRRSLTGGNGRFVTYEQRYREVRAGLGLATG